MMSGRERLMLRSPSRIRPAGRLVEAGEHVEQGRLAGAVGPDQRHDRRGCGIVSETSLTATRPPNSLVTASTTHHRGVGSPARRRRSTGAPVLTGAALSTSWASSAAISEVSSSRRRRSGIRPCGRRTITSTSRKPKIPYSISVSGKFSPSFCGQAVEHVGDQVVVDVAEQQAADHRAPDRAQAADDHHRQDEDREAELELAGVDRRVVGAEEGAGHAAEHGADRVGRAAWCARAGCPSRRPPPRPRAAPPRPGPAASRAAAG